MVEPNFSYKDNKINQPLTDIDDMSISEPNESGVKGGMTHKQDAVDDDQGNISLVDFLWKHRND